jgi:PAS domain S-box-containing protein
MLKRHLEREIKARKAAESLLESKSLELYRSNEKLRQLASSLESEVKARTLHLEKSEVKYRSIIENMNLGLVELDESGNILKTYAQFHEKLGYEYEELIGRPVDSILHSDQSLSYQSVIVAAHNNKKAFQAKLTHKKGWPIWALVSIAPFENISGETEGFLGIHYDITDRIKLEQALEQARIDAEKAREAEKNFLVNMSHEMRTTLNAIIGMSHLLPDTRLDGEQQEYLEILNNSAEFLKHLITDILNLSKIDAGYLTIDRIPFSLDDLLNSMLRAFHVRNTQNPVTFEIEFDSHLHGFYSSDSNLLSQILMNLLSNAEKFTSEGRVLLRVSKMAARDEREDIQFEVVESGDGIDPGQLKSIFEPYVQSDWTMRANKKGTGLGLAISRSLVDVIGGHLSVSSSLGRGSNFFFTIPLDKEASRKVRPKDDTRKHDKQSVSFQYPVLVVEDNEVNQKYVGRLLEKWSIDFVMVENGQLALDVIDAQDISLILMDLQMPIINGIETSMTIRKKSDHKSKIPVIALTAHSLLSWSEEALKAGMNDFVSKPFTPDQLKLVLSTYGDIGEFDKSGKLTFEYCKSLDQNGLKELYGNDAEFAFSMFDNFLNQIDNEIHILHQLLEDGDLKGVKHQAHKMKPSFQLVGLSAITDMMKEIEELANLGDAEKVCNAGKIFYSELDVAVQNVAAERERLADWIH